MADNLYLRVNSPQDSIGSFSRTRRYSIVFLVRCDTRKTIVVTIAIVPTTITGTIHIVLRCSAKIGVSGVSGKQPISSN